MVTLCATMGFNPLILKFSIETLFAARESKSEQFKIEFFECNTFSCRSQMHDIRFKLSL